VRIMAYNVHPLELQLQPTTNLKIENKRIKDQERQARVNWLAMSPQEQSHLQQKVTIDDELRARLLRDRVANAVAPSWHGGRTRRRLKKRRATRRAKRRTRRSKP
jgi:hypothetical protein